MRMKHVYVCDLCDRCFDSDVEAEECEQSCSGKKNEKLTKRQEFEQMSKPVDSIKGIVDLVQARFPELKVYINLPLYYVINGMTNLPPKLEGPRIVISREDGTYLYPDKDGHILKQVQRFLEQIGLKICSGGSGEYSYRLDLDKLPKLKENFEKLYHATLKRKDDQRRIDIYTASKNQYVLHRKLNDEELISLTRQINELENRRLYREEILRGEIQKEFQEENPMPEFSMPLEEYNRLCTQILDSK